MTEPDPHVLGPGLAPTPFTADEIRRACPVGRLVTSKTEAADGTVLRVTIRYLSCDDEGGEFERTERAPDGTVVDRDAGRS